MLDKDERVPLPGHFQAPGLARVHVRNFCAEMADHVVATAQILTSELVTSVAERSSALEVLLSVRGDLLRIEVCHSGPPTSPATSPEPPDAHGLLEEGVALLDALSLAWGTGSRSDDEGPCMWFTLRAR